MTRRAAAFVRSITATSLVSGGGFLLFVAMTVVNGSNFVFHVAISRILGPSSYGALGALLGLLLVLQVPVGAFQVAITREVAARRNAGSEEEPALMIGGLVAQSVVLSVLAAILVAATAGWLRSFLHLPSKTSVVLLGLTIVPIVIGLVPKAVLLGQLRFRPVAIALVVGAVVRVVAGIVLSESGRGVNGAMAATVLAELTASVALLAPLRRSIGQAGSGPVLDVPLRETGGPILAMAGYWLFLAIDTVLARHFLPRAESGFYAAAATAARAVLFLPGAIALIAFPQFAEAGGRSHRASQALKHALVAVGGLGLASAAMILLFPRIFISVIFGGAYGASTPVVGLLAFSAAVMGIVNILIHYTLARRSRLALAVWIGVAIVTVGIVMFHSSPVVIAEITLIGGLVSAAFLILSVNFRTREAGELDELDGALNPLWNLAEPEVDVSVVVPFYNPGPRFRSNLERLVEVFARVGVSHEVIAVSDGSTDGSMDAIRDLEATGLVHCITRDRNVGKGSALRVGLANARGRYVGFIDADGDLDPELFAHFLTFMQLYEPDIILGSKRHPLSEVDYPGVRRVYSWGYQQLIRLLFRLNIRDTQTGIKLIRREVLARVLPLMVEKRFAFDLELFVVARHLGYTRFFEAPVRIHQRFSSTISAKAVRGMLTDTLAIFYRLYFVQQYEEPTAAEALQEQSAARLIAP